MKEFIATLTWVDFLVLLVTLWGCCRGYKSGLFPELLKIASYLVTVVLTFRFYEPLGQYITVKTFLNLTAATAVSFGSLLIVVFVVTKLLTMLFLKLLKVGDGGFVYRLLGLVLGACRWVILLSLLFMMIDMLPLEPLKADIHRRSVVGNTVARIAPVLFDFMSSLSPQLGVGKKSS